MPIDPRDYPPDWSEITRARKDAAGWKCEWCEVEQGALRFNVEGELYQVILTTAHLGVIKPDGSDGDKHDKMDCRPENLAVLCQVCHLNYDRVDHIRKQRENRLRHKRDAALQAGQIPLFEEVQATAQ